jgi:hypothetical protein
MEVIKYSVKGKNLDQLLEDLDRGDAQANRGGDAYELAQAAIAVETAKAMIRWAKIAGIAACVSTLVAKAAVLVAAIH